MRLRSLTTTLPSEDRAVSPIVGAILMVAVTVLLSATVGVFVFNIGGSIGESVNVGVTIEAGAGQTLYSVQIVDNQNADKVVVETSSGQTYTLDSVGTPVKAQTFNHGSFNVFGVKDGSRHLLKSRETVGGWAHYLGDGSDGSLTVTNTTTVNDYSHLTANATTGATTIEVNDGSKFAAGDEVLIVQMQNASGGTAGAYELHRVTGVSGNTLSLNSSLIQAYATGEYTARNENAGNTTDGIPADNPGTVTQVVRIPHYTDVTIDGGTITAPQWNGQTGGIVFFRATGTVTFQNGGTVNVSGKGFHGGLCGSCGDDWDGGRGEGINGWHYGGGIKHYADEVSLNNMNGGGGNHVDGNDGGDPAGGGGHAGAGSNSSEDSQSAYPQAEGGDGVGLQNLRRMYFGGGGGAGADADSRTPIPENSHGGGIAIISADTIQNARVFANGIDGKGNHDSGSAAAQSGGGAGGTIYLSANSVSSTNVSASGGEKAVQKDENDVSGAGAPGRIRIDAEQFSGNVTPSPLSAPFAEFNR